MLPKEIEVCQGQASCKYENRSGRARKGFTLVELMAVVVLIMVLLGAGTVMFMNGRESVKIRSDANHLISFMKSMLDYTKATGVPLVLQFGEEDKSFSYIDPRNQATFKAKMESKARVLAIKLNDRLYLPGKLQIIEEDVPYGESEEETSVYIAEGRGLITMAVMLGTQNEEEKIEQAMLTRLNLISGKGQVFRLNPQEVEQFLQPEEDLQEAMP